MLCLTTSGCLLDVDSTGQVTNDQVDPSRPSGKTDALEETAFPLAISFAATLPDSARRQTGTLAPAADGSFDFWVEMHGGITRYRLEGDAAALQVLRAQAERRIADGQEPRYALTMASSPDPSGDYALATVYLAQPVIAVVGTIADRNGQMARLDRLTGPDLTLRGDFERLTGSGVYRARVAIASVSEPGEGELYAADLLEAEPVPVVACRTERSSSLRLEFFEGLEAAEGDAGAALSGRLMTSVPEPLEIASGPCESAPDSEAFHCVFDQYGRNVYGTIELDIPTDATTFPITLVRNYTDPDTGEALRIEFDCQKVDAHEG